jgi:hypothetical protein
MKLFFSSCCPTSTEYKSCLDKETEKLWLHLERLQPLEEALEASKAAFEVAAEVSLTELMT